VIDGAHLELFVDRDSEIEAMLDLVRRTADGRGGLAAVAGSAGMGKSAMLRALADRSQRDRRARLRLIPVNCYGSIGDANSYGPFLELLRVLRAGGRRSRRLLKVGARAVTEGSPELLGLVPAIGPLLRAGAAATKVALEGGPWKTGDDPVPGVANVVQAIAEAVTGSVRAKGPLVVIVDDAHRIDASSCAVLAWLVDRIRSLPLSFILAYRPEAVGADHPLQQLLGDADVRGDLTRTAIGGFARDALRDYLRSRFAFVASDSVIDWLQRVTGGHPIFVAQYLTMLEERQLLDRAISTVDIRDSGASADSLEGLAAPIFLPTSVDAVMRERIRHIDPVTRQLLLVGAVEGEWFTSAVCGRVCELAHAEVIDRLHAVSRDYGMIQPVRPTNWNRQAGSDLYRFEHALMRLAFYQDQSSQARRERHVAVAAELERMTASLQSPPQEVVLDIASHYHLGGATMLAAERTLAIARGLASQGGSLTEATNLCRRALDDIRATSPGTRDIDRVHVEIIELLLVITMLRWRGRPELQGDLALNDLATEATAAAARSGDADLRARALFMEGRILLRTHGPSFALPKLRSAAELARAGRNPVTRFTATAEYGHHLAKVNLGQGMEILSSAEAMYGAMRELHDSDNPVVRNLYDEVETQLAINYFDIGNFDESLRRLDACIDSLRARGRIDELSGALNYRAQVQIGLGRLEDAVTTLVEAVAYGERTDVKTGWHAWNLGLLGRAEAELANTTAARALVEGAWSHAQRNWIINIVPVVRVYYGDVTLRDDPPQDLFEGAMSMLRAAVEEARQAGLPRSEVNALSLIGRAHLARGDIRAAAEASQRAIDLFRRVGPMSTVRAEEVLFNHALVLRQLGDRAGAKELLGEADRLVRQKAATLGDPDMKVQFLGVGLNRAIRDALAST
jgi:tetratricopeptide (TPR) repeat protein